MPVRLLPISAVPTPLNGALDAGWRAGRRDWSGCQVECDRGGEVSLDHVDESPHEPNRVSRLEDVAAEDNTAGARPDLSLSELERVQIGGQTLRAQGEDRNRAVLSHVIPAAVEEGLHGLRTQLAQDP